MRRRAVIEDNDLQPSQLLLLERSQLRVFASLLMPSFISVIIPTCYREKFLLECVESVLLQDYREFEIIIIDQAKGSTLTQSLKTRFPDDTHIRYIHTEQGGAARARNLGIRHSRGPIVAFIDDDAVAEAGWMEAIAETFAQEPKPALMAGRLLPLWDGNKPEWYPAEREFLLGLYDIGSERRVLPEGDLPIGANMAGLLEVIRAFGGFEETLGPNYFRKRKRVSGEETVLGRKIRNAGHVAVYEPKASVRHHISPAKLSRLFFLKRHFWEGGSDATQMQLLGQMGASSLPHYKYHVSQICMAAARFALPEYNETYADPRSAIRMSALSRIAYSLGVLREIGAVPEDSAPPEQYPPLADRPKKANGDPVWFPDSRTPQEYTLSDLKTQLIDSRPDLADVRAYNRQMLDIFAEAQPVRNRALLDVGASAHGFALERALELGVAEYCGIGLGCGSDLIVRSGKRVGALLNMNADELDLPSATFDRIITLSTFEHFFNPTRVLREMYRVLRPGGSLLLNFQPVWTSLHGHHLHHVPDVCSLLPPWSHLRWSREEMHHRLESAWPAAASMSLAQVTEWIYDSDEINRLPASVLREALVRSPFRLQWMTPLRDEWSHSEAAVAKELSSTYPTEDLGIKGFSALLSKEV